MVSVFHVNSLIVLGVEYSNYIAGLKYHCKRKIGKREA
jgi:hypothetical protein